MNEDKKYRLGQTNIALRPEPNGRYFAENMIKSIFMSRIFFFVPINWVFSGSEYNSTRDQQQSFTRT